MNHNSFVPGKNMKADQFERYMKENHLSFFRRQNLGGPMDTVAFLTHLPAGDHRLVTAVLTDNSLYTLIHVHLGQAPTNEKRRDFMHYLNHLNTLHSVFKYFIDEENHVFLDVCITFRSGRFDADLIRTILNLISYFLRGNYKDIVKRLEKSGEDSEDFTL